MEFVGKDFGSCLGYAFPCMQLNIDKHSHPIYILAHSAWG